VAGSALACEQLLPGKMMLLDMMTPSSELNKLTRKNNGINCSGLASIFWPEIPSSCFLSSSSQAAQRDPAQRLH